MIISIMALFLTMGWLINLMISTTYEARTDLLVNQTATSNNETGFETSDIEMNIRFTETYKDMIKSDRILNEVIFQLNGAIGKADLIKSISVGSTSNSPIITIIVRQKKPEMALKIVDTYAAVFQGEMLDLMGMKNINILDAVSNEADIKEIKQPFYIINIISIILGFGTAFTIMLIQEFFFTKLNTVTKAERILKTPNLGNLPPIKTKTKYSQSVDSWEGKLISNISPPTIFLEEFSRIRANVQYFLTKNKSKTILVTSSVSGDGKSLISSNLAIIMAMSGKNTVYIDADLRNPIGRGIFNLPMRSGLTTLVEGHSNLDDILQKTSTDNLSFLSSGPLPPNPAKVLSSDGMVDLLSKLKVEFDVIIIDTPALEVADAISLSALVDGCLYVIDAKRTKETTASKNLEQLKKVGAPILGTILNRDYSSSKVVTYKY